jgi:hypothetical protein
MMRPLLTVFLIEGIYRFDCQEGFAGLAEKTVGRLNFDRL